MGAGQARDGTRLQQSCGSRPSAQPALLQAAAALGLGSEARLREPRLPGSLAQQKERLAACPPWTPETWEQVLSSSGG